MDTANLAASWVSAIVTTVGLGSILTQVSTIKNQLDPFRDARGEDHLAYWGEPPASHAWYKYHFAKPAPDGPILEADVERCLGEEIICVSRRPIGKIGKASWTVLLAVLHPYPPQSRLYFGTGSELRLRSRTMTGGKLSTVHKDPAMGSNMMGDDLPWCHRLGKVPLIFYKDVACTTISRTTIIIIVILTTVSEAYRYDGPAGLRLGYAGYNGTFQIEWPLGQRPTLTIRALERYQSGTDVIPK